MNGRWTVMLAIVMAAMVGCDGTQTESPTSAGEAAAAATATADWHTDLSLEEALEQAAAEHKHVVVGVFSLGGAGGRQLERDVLRQAETVALLEERTIAIRSAPTETIRTAYDVNETPTLLFLDKDGHEIERIVGPIELEAFLERVPHYLEGWDQAMILREEAIVAQRALADLLAVRARLDEALDAYLAALDACQAAPELFDEHAAGIVRQIRRLSMTYDPAEAALEQRAAAARDALEAGTLRATDFMLLTLALRMRGHDEEILPAYEQVIAKCDNAEVLAACTREVLPRLVAARRFDALSEHLDVAAAAHRVLDQLRSQRPDPRDFARPTAYRGAREQYDLRIADTVVPYYTALIGLEQFDEAEVFANRLLAFAGGPEVCTALARAAYRLGHVDERVLALARKADELGRGVDVETSATLARILDATGQTAEARALLDERIPLAGNDDDRAVLEAAREEIADVE